MPAVSMVRQESRTTTIPTTSKLLPLLWLQAHTPQKGSTIFWSPQLHSFVCVTRKVQGMPTIVHYALYKCNIVRYTFYKYNIVCYTFYKYNLVRYTFTDALAGVVS